MTSRTDDAEAALDTTVLIAGAGPAGLAGAAELNSHGIDCLVVEPRESVSSLRPRAKTTSVRTMEYFRRWGIANAVRTAAPIPLSWSNKVVFCTSLSGREITSFPGAFGLTTARDDVFAESSQAVPQPVIEQVLRRHLADRHGVRFELGSSVADLTEKGDHVEVTVRDKHGRVRRVRARYVLGCDGPSSVVRQRIGARLVGRSDPRPNFNVVFTAPRLQTHLPPAVQYWVVGGTTPGLIGRLDLDGTWWAIFPGVDAATGEENVAELIDSAVGRTVEHEIVAVDPWTARMLVADRFQTDRVFLVGEAAHLNPPWGGHGYNTSVGDAVNIGWKIAAVVQGWGGSNLLASYESERRPVVARTVEVAETNMGTLAGDLGVDATKIQEAKRAEFHSLGLVLGYSYAGSPVIQGGPGAELSTDISSYEPSVEAGSRLPHLWLDDGRSLYDLLGPGLTLIGPFAEQDAAVRDIEDLSRRLGVPLTLLESPTGWPWGRQFVLVRPDQHVAWSGHDAHEIDVPLVLGCERSSTTPRRAATAASA